MSGPARRFVLGSRSPRRIELLRLLVPADAIDVLPPRSADEPGFDGIHDWPAIERRLTDIARRKSDDVLDQLRSRGARDGSETVITADTTIVVSGSDGRLLVLGQPLDDETWPNVVRSWFRTHYFGKTHAAVTAVCVAAPDGSRQERVVRSRVTMSADGERWLDWYIATGEPRGKAGGYALQGAGSLFIEQIEGSASNVIGLPLRELAEMLGRS
jgi:septum formation protein